MNCYQECSFIKRYKQQIHNDSCKLCFYNQKQHDAKKCNSQNISQCACKWQPVSSALVKMNITISKEYLEEVLGEELLNQFLTVFSINAAIQKYLIPWVATITVVINSMVCIMCLGIYIKTKGKNHRPAFVFIFFLNFVDVLLGMYVKKTLK